MLEILDYQLQHYLRHWISEMSYGDKLQLKNIHMCNQHTSAATGHDVYLLADDEGHARYTGLMTCKNAFCCPVCSSVVMEKYRANIATAIEMLAPKEFGFMVTMTIPHLKFMGWRETMDILYDTWKYFRQKSFNRGHGHTFHEFTQVVPCDNWVRVAEFTWSKINGAHPHFHSIWWTPRGNEGKVLEWEERLNDFWLKHAKRIMIKYWKRHKLHADLVAEKFQGSYEIMANKVFWSADQKDGKTWRQAFKFSRDKNGNLLEAKTSDYICGWGADRELTGNVRKQASYEGHYTPYQILEMARTNPEYRAIYLDFCLAVTRKPVHHRVNFSKNGLLKLVQEYRIKKEQTESSSLQKKSAWEVVCYFTQDDWYDILDRESEFYADHVSNILWLAANRREILLEYMDAVGISYHLKFGERNKAYMSTFVA